MTIDIVPKPFTRDMTMGEMSDALRAHDLYVGKWVVMGGGFAVSVHRNGAKSTGHGGDLPAALTAAVERLMRGDLDR